MDSKTEVLPVVRRDRWLGRYAGELSRRYRLYRDRLEKIEDTAGSIVDFANGYLYYGFRRDDSLEGWWFRDWLPGAFDVYLFGDFNGWQRTELPLRKLPDGTWEIFLPDEKYARRLVHGSLVKMLVHGENGWLERIPSYIRRTVQNEETKDFAGQFWNPPRPFDWKDDWFNIAETGSLLIYECHIGMAQDKDGVGTYREFTSNILPRVKKLGYNAIQIMGIAEHPYYGSFGYHVSNFFAPSSRFGTPEELKELIRVAHRMGIGVIMDIVHSHYVKNINEGLNELDGTGSLYSPAGDAGYQPFWDSKLFDYSKEQVLHFLLSNVKYWLDEFRFDGFRFDGVTSMIYHSHNFDIYTESGNTGIYFGDGVNRDALCYLTLANELVHEFRPAAVTIAEDVSGMPAMCAPVDEGGVGFDYRLAMGIPDFWIRMLEDIPDEQWDIWDIWNVMTDRLPYVGTVAYTESHDQALVGEKTIAFRLMDRAMYTDMSRTAQNIIIDRGMALHKMIRLVTISLGGQAYLNFMGNEFGHPEWIDFPRAGNGWSYAYARRQWNLASNPLLRYSYLNRFDADMIKLVRKQNILKNTYACNLQMDTENKTMAFSHGDVVFVFNWHPERSIDGYSIHVPHPGKYHVLLSTDDENFGGQGRHDRNVRHFSYPVPQEDGTYKHYMKIYNVCRTAIVFRKNKG